MFAFNNSFDGNPPAKKSMTFEAQEFPEHNKPGTY